LPRTGASHRDRRRDRSGCAGRGLSRCQGVGHAAPGGAENAGKEAETGGFSFEAEDAVTPRRTPTG